MKKYLPFLITALVLLFSFALALKIFPSHVTFGYDQARDAYEARSIWRDHNLKILGPTSDVPGINHGVLWYYFLAAVYYLTKGDPESAAFLQLCLLYLFIPVIGVIAHKLTKNLKDSLLTVSLYALAPLFASYTYWLSNPTLSLFITPLLLLAIWQYISKQNKILAFLIGIGYGLLIQSDFAFAILILTIPMYAYLFKLQLVFKNALLFLLGFGLAITSFVLSYIKFNTNIFKIVLSFLGKDTNSNLLSPGAVASLTDSVINLLSITFLPFPKTIVFLLLIITLIYRRKILDLNNRLTKFLLVWLSGIILLFVFNHGSLSAIFFFGPFVFPLALLVSSTINNLFSKKPYVKYAALFVITIFQISLIFAWHNKNYSPLTVQNRIYTTLEKEIINYTYAQARGKQFVVNSVTNPLYINTTWAYLYEFYGQNKYNYLPFWGGRSQTGYLGNLPQNPPFDTPLRFLIMEPQAGIEEIWLLKTIYEEDKVSDIVEEKKFGDFTVQKRLFHPDKKNVPIPALLRKHPLKLGE